MEGFSAKGLPNDQISYHKEIEGQIAFIQGGQVVCDGHGCLGV